MIGADLVAKVAGDAAEIEQAYRLRYTAFVEEHGLHHLSNRTGTERDAYDAYCDHLVVKDVRRDMVVATYRLLPGRRVPHQGLYTASEFDLADFGPHVARTLELGRACVHPDYRDGGAMLLLWDAMLEYYVRDESEYVIGCVSLRAAELRHVHTIRALAAAGSLPTVPFGIRPHPTHRVPWPDDVSAHVGDDARRTLPATIKGYLRLGGQMVAEPAYDPTFETYDFCMLMAKAQMSPTYRELFAEVMA